MAEHFWDVSELRLIFFQTFQNSGAEFDELEDVGNHANYGKGFCHVTALVLDA